jgi:hypothetical protein
VREEREERKRGKGKQRRKRARAHSRESVLFIGTQFSILCTSMYSPAEAATQSEKDRRMMMMRRRIYSYSTIL